MKMSSHSRRSAAVGRVFCPQQMYKMSVKFNETYTGAVMSLEFRSILVFV